MNNTKLPAKTKENTSIYFRKSKYIQEVSIKKKNTILKKLKEGYSIETSTFEHIGETCIPNKKFKAGVSHKPNIKVDNEGTPLLQQYTEIRNKNPSLLLFIECGYKYRFFEKDAEIASRELQINRTTYHGMLTASIPTYRLHIHVERLTKKGYKVGVVNQSEAPAIKLQYESKRLPFSRNLTGIYTRATLIGEHVSPLGDDATQISGPLITILEESIANASSKFAVVIINVAIGQIFIDEFVDSDKLELLDSRLECFQPIEFLVPEDLSASVKMIIKSYISCQCDVIRTETYNSTNINYSSALYEMSSVVKDDTVLEKLSNSKLVLCCLFATYQFLKEFGLQSILSTLQPGDEFHHVIKLPAATVRNLEMVKNNSDHSVKYSLYWVLNKTETKFGARLLYSWIVNPLTDLEKIKERHDVIDELIFSDLHIIHTVKNVSRGLPDFESALVAIFYRKCSPFKFYATIEGLSSVYDTLQSLFWKTECMDYIQSPKLKEILSNIMNKLKTVRVVMSQISVDAARQNKKSEILLDWCNFPDVVQLRHRIRDILHHLENLRPVIAKTLNMEDICYSTFYADDFLIEVKLPQCCFVPQDWQLICSSKNVKRYRCPEVQRLHRELQRLKKELEVQCNEAWMLILEQFLVQYYDYKSAVHSLATLDVLTSLAKVSTLNGYVKPMFNTENNNILIEEGRHPIISVIKSVEEPFIANSTCMKANSGRVVILTGPNMGGKSCYMKQVALICIMAQIGCFVPADSATLPILDGVYVRMGASDEMGLGRSTFMLETCETSEIINNATDRSLVILDEFGRGTSTCDGTALASAVLQYFIQHNCFLIFVTHYSRLCEFENKFPMVVTNYHMSYIVIDDDNDSMENVAFLYQLVCGRTESSYGLNVARLGGLPSSIISRAAVKARQQENIILQKTLLRKSFIEIFTTTNNIRRKIESIPKL